MHNSEGSKRQLPPWMMQKAGANRLCGNSNNVVETNCSVENGDIITENAGNGTKENATLDQKRETLKRKSELNAKCEVKRRRNLSKQDGSGYDIMKKKKVQASSDDNVELTVEDLMAIAKQYVKDYEDKRWQETSVRQHESDWQFTAKGESGTTLDSCCENTKASSSSRETLCNPTPTTTFESITTSPYQFGDPAQEMLDLFLGPLLKKTLEIEKEEEEKNKSIADSLEVTHVFTRQSQDDLVDEDMVPLMKKRSTLKDKVAMFLD